MRRRTPTPSPPDASAERLRARYLHLTRTALPAAARQAAAVGEPWPVRLDHCFMRIVLDNLFGCRWDTVLDPRSGPAYRQLSNRQLNGAVELAKSMLACGVARVVQLNDQSLQFRKRPPSSITDRLKGPSSPV